ncbi:hypothetical protein M0811_08922 [Anaeramoeba ignava]|uniref:Uncharacterized protein n=1 Tax=Anaeramoeba ignava TaxID=1746090 RepID=A0A9Q0LIS7_ANAIG|nr:hypothetical protein M0811_08922 [Anaeramoeba ignava]
MNQYDYYYDYQQNPNPNPNPNQFQQFNNYQNQPPYHQYQNFAPNQYQNFAQNQYPYQYQYQEQFPEEVNVQNISYKQKLKNQFGGKSRKQRRHHSYDLHNISRNQSQRKFHKPFPAKSSLVGETVIPTNPEIIPQNQIDPNFPNYQQENMGLISQHNSVFEPYSQRYYLKKGRSESVDIPFRGEKNFHNHQNN